MSNYEIKNILRGHKEGLKMASCSKSSLVLNINIDIK